MTLLGKGHRYPVEVISHCVWRYFRFFILQLIVSILAFGARDVLTATLMACFSGTWLANSLVPALEPPSGTEVLGLLNLVFAVFALLMATVAHRKPVMWFVLCVAVPRFAVTALFNFTGAAWLGYVSGALGLLLAGVAMYAAFAPALKDMRGEEVLPVGRRCPAYDAVEGDLAARLRNLERQAGVRRTL
ncbi:hypothetical protein ACIQZB_25815 [Streptomyces sp. NPDC097727]|uniref:hypothetical protein n=1 Tax=Streptomyces sp. NPDC097727 TaxID=3366092 RepID=UPI0037FFFED3